jgi:hypothetical protein
MATPTGPDSEDAWLSCGATVSDRSQPATFVPFRRAMISSL